MALPTNTPQSREEILAQRRAAEEEALLREVDDAVRADDMASFGKRYGRTLGVGIGALVLAFGGYLYWESRQEAAREAQAEALVTALDQAQAGNFAAATESTASIAKDGGEGPRASARMLAAGAAMAQNRPADAAKLLGELADDASAPQEMRDLARIRQVAIAYDTMDKGKVVSLLGPLARPDSPWFGSAGEMLAMAYLDQGKRAEAGRLFSEIARNTTVPTAIRSRARQMAGVLGVDAIVDVDQFMEQQRRQQQSAASAAPAAQPAA